MEQHGTCRWSVSTVLNSMTNIIGSPHSSIVSSCSNGTSGRDRAAFLPCSMPALIRLSRLARRLPCQLEQCLIKKIRLCARPRAIDTYFSQEACSTLTRLKIRCAKRRLVGNTVSKSWSLVACVLLLWNVSVGHRMME